ncbi:MAG: DEAD/DEAH box helicase [Deltaproteobacteria bacterium]|nr:DEAD/DEAH box helicase [Deltaproteobacteria bacterium]
MPSEKSAPSNVSFSDFNLITPVTRILDEIGYESPTPIQALTIPPLMEGCDLLGQAQTGTGKTAAFAIPGLCHIDVRLKKPQMLVLTPTRELAIQVAEAFQKYATHIKGFKVLPIYGGQHYGIQLSPLRRGVHVIVGTPGRVMDHMRKGTLKLDNLQTLVLDEADEMLRMGFIDDVEWVLEQIPDEHQTVLFSATIPPAIKRIAKKYLNEPKEITIEVRTTAAETIRQHYWIVGHAHKLDTLTRILEVTEFDGMLIFVKTKTATLELSEKLAARGYASAPLNGDIAQKHREATVDKLKKGRLDIIVATDVAARGLDVERISHVINYDVPHDVESYVHRIGRTGRAGRTGDAILFVNYREKRIISAIERATKQKIKRMALPTTEAVNDVRIARFNQRITDTLASNNLDLFRKMMEQYQSQHNVTAIDIAAAMAKLVQGDEPLLVEDIPKERDRKPERRGRDSRAQKKETRRSGPEEGMETYRIEVGYDDGVQPSNIVGAIANEGCIESKFIGRIDINEKHSLVDLPIGMPKETFQLLKKAWICQKQLRISRVSEQDETSKYQKQRSNKKDTNKVKERINRRRAARLAKKKKARQRGKMN